MTTPSLSAQDVARFLQKNPEFFSEHASVFADLTVPHPHQTRAISLGERQILTLRARTRDLEWQLAGLIQNATGNERISKLLIDWCAGLLAEKDPSRLPDVMIQGLSRLFGLPDIGLRLWGLPDNAVPAQFTQDVSDILRHDTQERSKPFCGPAGNHEATSWLDNAPESMALIPLSAGTPPRTLGLLVLGSPDPERFTEDMGTEFLETIATLAGASLSRLLPPGHDGG